MPRTLPHSLSSPPKGFECASPEPTSMALQDTFWASWRLGWAGVLKEQEEWPRRAHGPSVGWVLAVITAFD